MDWRAAGWVGGGRRRARVAAEAPSPASQGGPKGEAGEGGGRQARPLRGLTGRKAQASVEALGGFLPRGARVPHVPRSFGLPDLVEGAPPPGGSFLGAPPPGPALSGGCESFSLISPSAFAPQPRRLAGGLASLARPPVGSSGRLLVLRPFRAEATECGRGWPEDGSRRHRAGRGPTLPLPASAHRLRGAASLSMVGAAAASSSRAEAGNSRSEFSSVSWPAGGPGLGAMARRGG